MTIPVGYHALRESAAWVDQSSRGKIVMSGEDRARLLHAMTTNHIQQMKPGDSCYAYFLNDKGRILADVNVLCEDETLLLDLAAETRSKIFEHLDKFIIADDVTLDDETANLATIAVEGPRAGAIVAGLTLSGFGVRTIDGRLLVVPVAEKRALIAQLEQAGAVEASAEAWNIVRLEQGRPQYGFDLSERFLSQEANQPHALSFTKGCYLGQEIVERVRSRGQVHRLLMPIEIESDAVPEPGTKIMDGANSMAEITSAAYSPAREKVVALAYVRTDKARPGAQMSMDGTTVTVAPVAASAHPAER